MALPKTFSSGERLFASDLNDNFEDLDTRLGTIDLEDLANVGGSPTDGQILSYDNGTSTWNPTDGGKLVAVESALFTGTQTNSTAAGANFAVTDLSITHTLADASNKLIISAFFGSAATTDGRGSVGIAVAMDGTLIALGDASSTRTRVTAGGFVNATASGIVSTMPSFTYVYAPGDTSSHTFTVEAINARPSTETIYINRTEDDSPSAYVRAASGLVIQEVKV